METIGKKHIARKLYGYIEVMNELGHTATLENISLNDRSMPRMKALRLLRGKFDAGISAVFHPEWVKIQSEDSLTLSGQQAKNSNNGGLK